MNIPENRPLEHKYRLVSYHCEYCLTSSKLPADYDGRHFCCEDCRIKYRKLKIKTPFIGEHVVSPRKGYVHHGLGDDKGGVLHYSGLSEGATSGPVIHTNFKKFSQGHVVFVIPYKHRKYSLLESVKRAEKRLGEEKYDMHSNNCEHFVSWCIQGKVKSRQVEKIATYTTFVIVVVTAILVFNIFAMTGFAAVSSSRLFPILAELHRTTVLLIFSVLGIIGGISLTLALSFTILRNFLWLSAEEQRSRLIARRSAYIAVIVTAVIAFVYIWVIADQVLVGDLIKRLGPAVITRLVNISLFLATGLSAIMGITIGLGAHKFLSRNISQV